MKKIIFNWEMRVLLMLTLAGRRKRVKKRRLSHQDIRWALIPARFLCGSRRKRLRGYIYSTPWMLIQCFVYEATMESVTKSLINIENFTKLTYILHSTIIFFFRQIKVSISNEAVVLEMCDPILDPLQWLFQKCSSITFNPVVKMLQHLA